jgi:hypothetical protein
MKEDHQRDLHELVREASALFLARSPMRRHALRLAMRLTPMPIRKWLLMRTLKKLKESLTREGYHPITQRRIAYDLLDAVEQAKKQQTKKPI